MNRLRCGLWGARADNVGLGNQSWEFYRHIQPDKTMVMDISDNYPERKQYFNRYPEATIIKGTPTQMDMGEFLKDLDVVFCMETAYNYEFFDFARGMGVKTILQYNWEFLEYIKNPNLPAPDLFASPSMWHFDDLPFRNKTFLPVPVNRDRLRFKRRTKIKTIIHIAGGELYDDRNGTEIFIKALPLLDPKLEVIVYSQHDLNLTGVRRSPDNYWDLYKKGDLIVLPRKYGGLCLPLNEAMSVGMIPLMTDVSPQSGMLAPMTLIKPESKKVLSGDHLRVDIDSYSVSPEELAISINTLASYDEEVIGTLSNYSNWYASNISWERLLPLYIALMRKLTEE